MRFDAAVEQSSVKTPEQLRSEIAYYTRQLQETSSADRQRRYHKSIEVREAALTIATARAAGVTARQVRR
jgi:hypothetical protein